MGFLGGSRRRAGCRSRGCSGAKGAFPLPPGHVNKEVIFMAETQPDTLSLTSTTRLILLSPTLFLRPLILPLGHVVLPVVILLVRLVAVTLVTPS